MKRRSGSKKKSVKATRGIRARKRVATSRNFPALEDEVVELATSGKLANAARSAIKAQLALGIPVVYKKGTTVIRRHPDNREEVIEHIQPIEYKVPRRVKVMRKK